MAKLVFRTQTGQTWRVSKLISKGGTYGSIYLVVNGSDRRAVKVYKHNYEDEIYSTEMTFMGIKHPCLVNGIEVGSMYDKNTNVKTGIGIMMKVAISDLSNIKFKYNLTKQTKKRLFYEICCGMNQLHSMGIIHIDVRCENFLIYNSYGKLHAKICDYSLSMMLNDEHTVEDNNLRIIKPMLPPEFIKMYKIQTSNKGPVYYSYTKQIDIYLLGLTIAALFSEDSNMLSLDVRSKFTDIVNKLEPELKSLLLMMSDDNQNQRPTIQEILSNKYFDDVRNPDIERIITSNKMFKEPPKIVSTNHAYETLFTSLIDDLGIRNTNMINLSKHIYHSLDKYPELIESKKVIKSRLGLNDLECELIIISYMISMSLEIYVNTHYLLPNIIDTVKKCNNVCSKLKHVVFNNTSHLSPKTSLSYKISSCYNDIMLQVMGLHVNNQHEFSLFKIKS